MATESKSASLDAINAEIESEQAKMEAAKTEYESAEAKIAKLTEIRDTLSALLTEGVTVQKRRGPGRPANAGGMKRGPGRPPKTTKINTVRRGPSRD